MGVHERLQRMGAVRAVGIDTRQRGRAQHSPRRLDLPEQLLGFRVPEVQQFTATKLDRDRLFSDDASLTQKLALTQKDLDSTGSDLKNLQASYAVLKDSDDKLQLANAQCQKTVTAYKKVAIKSRWQKIWAGTKKGAEIAGALLAGYELGKHL